MCLCSHSQHPHTVPTTSAPTHNPYPVHTHSDPHHLTRITHTHAHTHDTHTHTHTTHTHTYTTHTCTHTHDTHTHGHTHTRARTHTCLYYKIVCILPIFLYLQAFCVSVCYRQTNIVWCAFTASTVFLRCVVEGEGREGEGREREDR